MKLEIYVSFMWHLKATNIPIRIRLHSCAVPIQDVVIQVPQILLSRVALYRFSLFISPKLSSTIDLLSPSSKLRVAFLCPSFLQSALSLSTFPSSPFSLSSPEILTASSWYEL